MISHDFVLLAKTNTFYHFCFSADEVSECKGSMGDRELRTPSLHEKLASFYCCYVREEAVDQELDADSVRFWEKIGSSRRSARERVCLLLNQIENTSAAHVRHLDNTYRAKRELVLLAEGTINTRFVSPSSLSSRRGKSAGVLAQVEAARVNNELLQECGALTVFSQHLQRSIHALRSLNFQHVDIDKVDALIGELQQDMVLMFHLILFNANKENAVFDRQLMMIGIEAPSYLLVTMLDCLSQMNVLPGFPIKRLLLLFYEWFGSVLGSFDTISKLKLLRKARNGTDKTVLEDEMNGLLQCKTFKLYQETTATSALDAQDPYYLQKKKFAKLREAIHDKYRHRPHHELKVESSSESDLATAPLDALDDEWEARCEVIYQLFLPRMRDYTSLLSNLVTISCGSALNARDKKTFFSRRPSGADSNNYGGSAMDFSAPHGMLGGGGGGPDTGNENQFWRWILREKSIVLDVANLIILLIFKHFRASNIYKGEYFMQFFLEANLLATLTKFMNKDIATYLQVSRQETEDARSGFVALEKEMEKLNIRFDDDMNEFSVQSTRTITTILRILQKLTKRKPNIIKNALCRSSSIVWLKVRTLCLCVESLCFFVNAF